MMHFLAKSVALGDRATLLVAVSAGRPPQSSAKTVDRGLRRITIGLHKPVYCPIAMMNAFLADPTHGDPDASCLASMTTKWQ
jgi:hypothetical protein